MIALSRTTRPLPRENARRAFLKMDRPLVEPKIETSKSNNKPPKIKTHFNSRALWRRAYSKCRKPRTTAEKAVSGDWRIIGLNKTPIIARAENIGFSIVASQQERSRIGRDEDKNLKHETRGEIRGIHTSRSAQAMHRHRRREINSSATSLDNTTNLVNTPNELIQGTSENAVRRGSTYHTKETRADLLVLAAEIEFTQIDDTAAPLTTLTVQAPAATLIGTQNILLVPQLQSTPQLQIDDEPIQEIRAGHQEIVKRPNKVATATYGARVEAVASGQYLDMNEHGIGMRHGFENDRIKVRMEQRRQSKRPSAQRRNGRHSTMTSPKKERIRTDEPRGRYTSKYVQTYRTRRFRQLKVVQASINPPES
ncbi:MAG: hypothetical protein ACP5N9_02550 [Candidatus Bilamarchaeum sp.]